MNEKKSSRRQFVQQSMMMGMVALGSINAGGENEAGEKQPKPPAKIRRYNTLGRTGFKVSDIAVGAPENQAVLAASLDAGVNYIDTGENYGNGSSERVIGKAIQGRDRKSLFITTKLMLKGDLSKASILRRARKCLERLQTEYIDCLMIHNATDVKQITCEGFHAAARQLKSEGRLRFTGVTSHGTAWWKNDKTLMTETMEKACLAAAADGRFDVLLFIYNFMMPKSGEKILRACREKNIGTTLMKINPVHNYALLQKDIKEITGQNKKLSDRMKQIRSEFEKMVAGAQGFIGKHNLSNPQEISTAALRFVLKEPGVNTVCCQMPNFEEMEHWLSLSGSGFSAQDKHKLAVYNKAFGKFYCRHACGICEANCPEKVPINTIMRYNHYFTAQRREKEAMGLYKNLSRRWSPNCRECQGFCQENCPYQVPVQVLLEMAHGNLYLG